jgi:P27 family predicted phage terminase small subunit
MPTKAVSSEVMEAGSGKHWTRAEREARKAASEGIKRKTRRSINAPAWLSKDAKQVWNRVLSSTKGVELLDNMDTEILAVYCDSYAAYKELTLQKSKTLDDIKALQAYSRIIAQYADKLGLNPTSRARLVKKKADKIKDSFGEKFDK